jgi:sugar O-acyltransferase (sialic acid O-acetyltransferase NeuD family)
VRILVWGAGGHASVVLDALRDGQVEVVGLLDDFSPESTRTILGIPVIGGIEKLASLRETGVAHVHIAVGDCQARLRLADVCEKTGFALFSVIHRSAAIAAETKVGPGSFIAAQSVVGPRSMLGRCTIVNHGSTVDHDCDLSDGVHVAPGVHIGGHVKVGRASFIGIGSALRDRIRIGSEVVLGAGSVAVDDIPDGSLALGVPARVVGRSGTVAATPRQAPAE